MIDQLRFTCQHALSAVPPPYPLAFRQHAPPSSLPPPTAPLRLSPHAGSLGIAHIQNMRTSTLEVQPHFVNSPLGIYLIHNGGLTNTQVGGKGGGGGEEWSALTHTHTRGGGGDPGSQMHSWGVG